MTEFGVDYSFARPTIAVLREHGVRFVCRYLSTQGNSKNLSQGEAASLNRAGINIVTVFETTASRALDGRNAGRSDASSALTQGAQCGQPSMAPTYYVVDFNPDSAQFAAIAEYFGGLCDKNGVGRIGVYGGYATCEFLIRSHLVSYVWQTYAWSGGQWSRHANIRQTHNGENWPGGQVDYDTAMTADYGQWRHPVSGPPPTTGKTSEEKIMQSLPVLRNGSRDLNGHVPFVRRLQAVLREVYGESLGVSGRYRDGVDGIYGPRTTQAVRNMQHRGGIAVDGICGPDTWTVAYTGARP
ncbi:MAG: glycoside hydrolase domain-containing protein [Bryobacteraceae bacterium]